MFKKVLGLRHWNNNVVKIPPPAAESGANASDVVVDTPEPYERILCQKILMGISTIDIIRNAIIKSCEQLNIEKERINELNEQNDKARSSLKSLVEFITEIGTTSSDIGYRMGDLNTSLTQINACIKEIQKIANQTNLIAINSAIEAARVGDAGRGFSVISKEVKNLSEDVKHSSKSVSTLTSVIKDNTARVSEVLDNQQPVIDNITTNINQIVESIGIVIDKSLSMKSVMQYISTVQFLNIVKVDHVIWKMEVYKLLLNKDINSKITMHDQCRLGKWYYGFEGQQFSNYYSFRSLEAPHKEVHTAGHSALNYFAAGDMNAMSQELDRMERSSNEVVNQLEMLAVDLLKETTL